MTGVRQAWLVARREMRERSRSRAFQASVLFLIVGVAAMLILPAMLKPSSTRDIGITGPAPTALAATIAQQAQAADITARIHLYASLAAGEQAVRQGQVDVLVADARRLEWNGKPDEQLKSMVTGAIQLATVQERAAAAGISPGSLMPGRIAMGAAAWWEPVAAAALTLAVIAGLVVLAGRVYTRAILHSGPALSLRAVWRDRTAPGLGVSGARTREAASPPQPAGVTAGGRTAMTGSDTARHRWLITVLTGTGVVVGVAVAVFTADVIIGVAAGAGLIAVANQMVRLWTRHTGPPVAPPLRPEDHQQPRAIEEGRAGRHDLDEVIRRTQLLAPAGAFWT